MRTSRLLLRRRRIEDLEPLSAINADPVVMEHFPAPLSSEQSAALMFFPAVELGWRLAREFWGRGIASEAAGAVIGYAFQTLGLSELLAYTAVLNLRSQRVMERLGMQRNPDEDFLHPKLPAGHPLAPQVLYRLRPQRAKALTLDHEHRGAPPPP